MNQKDATVEMTVIYVHETVSAVLVDAGLKEDIWIPKSQLVDFNSNEHNNSDVIEIEVSEWFAVEKDLA